MHNSSSISIFNRNIPISVMAPGVDYMKIMSVNVFFVSSTVEGKHKWFLVDTGFGPSAGKIKKAASYLFGHDARPEAIFLTHGHIDHIGGVAELSNYWDVPVYAHSLEHPYLSGKSDYPPADSSLSAGSLSFLNGVFPTASVNIADKLTALPEDGSLPGFPDWKAVQTPGHSPGHVSYFRSSDRTLIAGDAFSIINHSSLWDGNHHKEVHGPPAFMTPDWKAASQSVKRLADLQPEVAGCGHGPTMTGENLRLQLEILAVHFRELAVPKQGRYITQSAVTDEHGVVSVPPPFYSVENQLSKMGFASFCGLLVGYFGRRLLN